MAAEWQARSDNGAGARFRTAWLPVTSNQAQWLPQAPSPGNDALAGAYYLSLLPEASSGGELTAAAPYLLMYYSSGFSGISAASGGTRSLTPARAARYARARSQRRNPVSRRL